MDESGLLIMRHIRVLQESSDREEILDAIEELRAQARGDGTCHVLECCFRPFVNLCDSV